LTLLASKRVIISVMFLNVGINVAVLLLAGFQLPILCEGWLKSSSITSAARVYISTTSLSMSSPSPGQFNRGSRPSAPPPPINQYIRANTVRLIVPGNDTGDEVMLGIFSLSDALLEAEKFQMDLVMINDKGDPPVCRVIDYGKYKYSLEKKKKENLKKQVNVDIKEVKMSYKIDQHDFDVRMRAVRKFLTEGDKVKVVVQFKGREMQHKELGRDLLQKIYQPIEDIAAMESTPKVEGRAMTMLVGPKKTT
jgi:translation initiation factor IF-3